MTKQIFFKNIITEDEGCTLCLCIGKPEYGYLVTDIPEDISALEVEERLKYALIIDFTAFKEKQGCFKIPFETLSRTWLIAVSESDLLEPVQCEKFSLHESVQNYFNSRRALYVSEFLETDKGKDVENTVNNVHKINFNTEEKRYKYFLNGETFYYTKDELREYIRVLYEKNNFPLDEEELDHAVERKIEHLEKYDGDPYGNLKEFPEAYKVAHKAAAMGIIAFIH
jgi:hypothetical protein